MILKKRIVLIVLLIVIIVVAGAIFLVCNQSDDFLSLDDYTISKSHYTYYATKAYDEAYKNSSKSESIWENKIADIDAEQWMKNYATDLCKRYLIVSKMFDDLGLTLDDSDNSEIKSTVYDEWNYRGRLAIYGPIGIDEEIFTDIITVEKKFEKLAIYYKEELDELVSDDDIKLYLTENYASVVYVAMSYQDESGNSSLDQYNTYCQQIKDGKTVQELALELNAPGSNRIVTSIDDEGGRLDFAIQKSGSSFPQQFVSELFEAEIGDIIYFDDTANMIYCICARTNILDSDYYLKYYHDEIKTALLGKHFEDKLDDKTDNYKISISNWNIFRFSIRDLY